MLMLYRMNKLLTQEQRAKLDAKVKAMRERRDAAAAAVLAPGKSILVFISQRAGGFREEERCHDSGGRADARE